MAGKTTPGHRPRKRAKSEPSLGGSLRVASQTGSGFVDLQKRSGLLWESEQRPGRGVKPALSREEIVNTAIGLADKDGLDAITMHAVAKCLGFTTMALYRYFPNKETLIDACVDAAMGLPPIREASKEGWRSEVIHWAYAKRAMMCSRPWLAELPFVAAPHGPNWLGWHEALLQALSSTGLSPEDMMDMLSIVHAYVTGASDTAISLARAWSRGMTSEEWARAVGADLCRAINDPRYPVLSGILTSQSGGISESSPLPAKAGRPRTMDESFDFGLQRVLDGIESYIDSLSK